MDVGSFLLADPQSPKLIQPCEGSFHHPPPLALSAAMLGIALLRAEARYGGYADLGVLPRRHTHGHLIRAGDDGVAVPTLLARVGWHQPAQAPAENRFGWLR
jgi:hypothetical protein